MFKGSKLTAEERNAILTLQSAGLTVRGIAEAIERSVDVCSVVLSEQSKLKKSSRRGSKPKTSERDRRHIIRSVSADDLSTAKVKAKLKSACSVCTVQRVFKSVDWLSCKKRSAKPTMMKRHTAERVAWASEKALRDDVDWHCVFSDEKKWDLDGPNGMRYQWTNTRCPTQPNVRRHSGGDSIMVWAGFSGIPKTELKFLTGRADSAKDVSSQQDNALCHTSREIKEWLASCNIKVMLWPAYSPDLNPIENVWGIMTQHVYAGGKQYDNLHDLQVAVQAAWDAVTSQQLDTLAQSMRHRCVKVLLLQGEYISYQNAICSLRMRLIPFFHRIEIRVHEMCRLPKFDLSL